MIDLTTAPIDTADVPTERRWKQSAILSTAVLEEACEMNKTYLGVLALGTSNRVNDADRTDASHFRLAAADIESQSRLARSPFTLFNARFHDSRFWLAQMKPTSVGEPPQRYLDFHTPHSPLSAFTDVALFYAWHLVRSNASAARILLGMSKSALKAFQSLPLHRIQRVAAEQSQLVTLRWCDHQAFWQEMLEAARLNVVERLEDLRLLGIQLIASEVASQELR